MCLLSLEGAVCVDKYLQGCVGFIQRLAVKGEQGKVEGGGGKENREVQVQKEQHQGVPEQQHT